MSSCNKISYKLLATCLAIGFCLFLLPSPAHAQAIDWLVTNSIMAFGTIFNIQGYNAKTLIARFIIAALLINFSLAIGNVLIGWTQSLSNVFLSAIGDVGARIATGVSIADLFQQSLTQTYTVDNRLWTETITIFINILLLS